MTSRIVHGDCIEAMAAMAEASVDAVVCDPPYGLEFMGKEWDKLGAPRWGAGFSKGAPAEAGVRGAIKALPSYGGSTNPTCRSCGGTRNGNDRESRRRCVCKRPNFPNVTLPRARLMQTWHEAWAREALRVLKPGGHLLAFGGTRTYHRLACAVEDAGFEIRDEVLEVFEATEAGRQFLASLSPEQLKALDRLGGGPLAWLYGSGFPKSTDAARAVRGDLAERWFRAPYGTPLADVLWLALDDAVPVVETAAAKVEGYGTALKPAHEPIVVARKPLGGTVSACVLEHGCGALNVDGCRIGTQGATRKIATEQRGDSVTAYGHGLNGGGGDRDLPFGRWPANVVLDEQAAVALDAQTGTLTSGKWNGQRSQPKTQNAYGEFELRDEPGTNGDSGGASRFLYVAKSSSAERNAGLDGFEERPVDERINVTRGRQMTDLRMNRPQERRPAANVHPTVKPIALMRWLVRLVTPPGGTVLDPFAGSGTTGAAAVLEGFDFVGIEREAEYVAIAEARIAWWAEHPDGMTLVKRLEAEKTRAAVKDSGQGSMFDLWDDAA